MKIRIRKFTIEKPGSGGGGGPIGTEVLARLASKPYAECLAAMVRNRYGVTVEVAASGGKMWSIVLHKKIPAFGDSVSREKLATTFISTMTEVLADSPLPEFSS